MILIATLALSWWVRGRRLINWRAYLDEQVKTITPEQPVLVPSQEIGEQAR